MGDPEGHGGHFGFRSAQLQLCSHLGSETIPTSPPRSVSVFRIIKKKLLHIYLYIRILCNHLRKRKATLGQVFGCTGLSCMWDICICCGSAWVQVPGLLSIPASCQYRHWEAGDDSVPGSLQSGWETRWSPCSLALAGFFFFLAIVGEWTSAWKVSLSLTFK